MPASDSTKIRLALRSGNRCAFLGCGARLAIETSSGTTTVGEAAHIRGEAPGAARYDRTYANVNAIENLIYMCPTHHTLIDREPSARDYTVEYLLGLKRDHSERVDRAVEREMPSVSFTELRVIGVALVKADWAVDISGLDLIELRDKIRLNNLADQMLNLKLGLAKRSEVQDFFEQMQALDTTFSSRVVEGLASEYRRLKSLDFEASEIFDRLVLFIMGICGDIASSRFRAAAFALISYVFELCEIFERV